jgi:hypothetical protein
VDLSWVDALPIGLVLFSGTLVGALRRKAGRELARKEYPRTAADLGLRFEPSAQRFELGRMKGEVDGKSILVSPDQGRIVIEFAEASPVLVRNYVHYKRTPPGLEPFSTGARWADGWLQNRYCAQGLAERLHQDLLLRELLEGLKPHLGAIKQFVLEERRLECVMHYASPEYIPGQVIREMVPALGRLAGYFGQELARKNASGT